VLTGLYENYDNLKSTTKLIKGIVL